VEKKPFLRVSSEMNRRVRRRCAAATYNGKRTVSSEECAAFMSVAPDSPCTVDWTSLPDDTVVQLFSYLNYRERASLSSTCRTWRALGSSSCLWASLDLRSYRVSIPTAMVLSSRCGNLRCLRLRGADSLFSISALNARGLCEISADGCCGLTDGTLAVLAARHEALQSIQIGPEHLDRVSSDALRHVAVCCTQLRRVRLSGLREIDGEAISTFARHCPDLEEVTFLDCGNIDEGAIGKITSLRFLSVAGSRNMKWATASLAWSKLPNLLGLDVSRTDVSHISVSRLLSQSKSLQLVCALNCPSIEEQERSNPMVSKGKILVTISTDIFKKVASLLFPHGLADTKLVFDKWRCNIKYKEKSLVDMMAWIEWILSYSLLRIADSNPHAMDEFWLKQGTLLLLSLVKSAQEDVQEKAATALATFVVIDDENANVDPARSEAVMKDGGILLLLQLARCCRESAQSEAAKVISFGFS
jgi:F-box-like